jgi:alpha-L-rhamnosidase
MGLVPDHLRAAAAGYLVAAIRAADWHLTTGFVGVGYLLPVLSSAGHGDVAYRLLAQRTLPSWRYMIDRGATTIWERWDGWSETPRLSVRVDELVQPLRARLGRRMALPVRSRDRPGPRHGRLRPAAAAPASRGTAEPRERLLRVAARTVRAGWERGGGQSTYRVEVPPNATASVHVPSAGAALVRDASGGEPAAIGDYPGLLGASEAVFEVGPGRHEFSGPGLQASR